MVLIESISFCFLKFLCNKCKPLSFLLCLLYLIFNVNYLAGAPSGASSLCIHITQC